MTRLKMACALVALAACGAKSPPTPLANLAHGTRSCPRAEQVYGPVQSSDHLELPLGTGTQVTMTDAELAMVHERDASFLVRGRSWLALERRAPCPIEVAEVVKMRVCQPDCEHKTVDYTAHLASSCKDPANGYAIVGDRVDDCRLVRLADIPDGTAVPELVRVTFERLRMDPAQDVELRGAGDYAWEISMREAAALNGGLNSLLCPHPNYVFVRGPDGVVQLDVNDSIDGLLVDREGLAVVMTGRYAIPYNQFFDVDRLPPHKADVISQSEDSCMR